MKNLTNNETFAIIESHTPGTGNGAWTEADIELLKEAYRVTLEGALVTPVGIIPEFNPNQFVAMVIREIDRAPSILSKINILERYSAGNSVTGAHFSSIRTGEKSPEKSPLKGHYLTAEGRRRGAWMQVFRDVDSITPLLLKGEELHKLGDKATKTQLSEFFKDLREAYYPPSEELAYDTLLKVEHDSAVKWTEFEKLGLVVQSHPKTSNYTVEYVKEVHTDTIAKIMLGFDVGSHTLRAESEALNSNTLVTLVFADKKDSSI